MRANWIALLLVTAGAAFHLAVTAASFDCTKARSIPEKLICGDPALSRRDEELARLYASAKAAAPDKAAFTRDAAAAWHRRESDCKDAACVSAWMDDRMAHYRPAVPAPTAAPAREAKAPTVSQQPVMLAQDDTRLEEAKMRIDSAQRCIEISQRAIDSEKEVGETVGFVNKATLYEAGKQLIACRKGLEEAKAEHMRLTQEATKGTTAIAETHYGPRQRAFAVCLQEKARTGSYSSSDGGQSALRMIGACRKAWESYMDGCAAQGNKESSCNFSAAAMAQAALKLRGR